MKEESFANEILHDYKKQNKRLFIIILVMLLLWSITLCYLLCKIDTKDEELAYTQISDIRDSNIHIGI